jgi:nitrate/TMAO reductase-like tetraheme cytochrome c subunit
MQTPKPLYTRFTEWLSPLVYLSSNPISLIGVVLITTATILWVFLLPTLIRGETTNPYVGIPAFLILPGVFIFGLILVPIGIFAQRARRKRQGLPVSGYLPLSLEVPQIRRLVGFIAAVSIVNVIIVAQWGYSAVNYMDTGAFCGLTCHNVMQPEYTAYIASAHARVGCVGCHIGAGASWFVKSKFSGLGQVIAVTLHNYPTPIPTPVENLRPAQDTCEQCHWPQRFSGDLFKVRTSYASDEQNKASSTMLLMKVGGHTWRGDLGIHGVHLDSKARVAYIATDKSRQVIPQVTYTAPDGKVTVFKSNEVKPSAEELARGQSRTMDCLDCHNRPAHSFQLPERAVDQAIELGQISAKLPYIKREAVAALRRDYTDRDVAVREIAASLLNFYETKYPQISGDSAADIHGATVAIGEIYKQNVFPDMKVAWGTYPNNLGHMDFPGCFRCHDGNHVSSDGRVISNDCAACHDLQEVDEKNPKVPGGILSNLLSDGRKP